MSLFSLPLHFGKVVAGSHGGEATPHEDIPRYMNLVRAGRVDLSKLITAVYPLSEVNQAIEDMRSGATAGRALIEMGS